MSFNPSRSRCACASTSPGMTVAFGASITSVRRWRHRLASAREPTAAIRPPSTASAVATGRPESMVRIRCARMTRSAATELHQRRRDLVQETFELAALIPRRQPDGHVAEPGVEVTLELLDAALRRAGDRPALDERRAELRRIVGVEERLRLLEAGLPVLADVQVVVERAADRVRIAALFLGHRADA